MHGSFSKRVDACLQDRSKNSFADETREQQAKHNEIAERYERERRERPDSARILFPKLRKAELERLFTDRCGQTLPDDDAGRDYLRLMADHLAQLGAHYIVGWTRTGAPWASDDELDDLIDLVGPGKHWKPGPLGQELNLTDDERTRLDIRTIRPVDSTKAQRAERRKKRKAATEAARRAKAGATPHALSEARLKPWLALGVSESTCRRRKRQAGSGDSNSCPILLESQCGTKHCQGAPPIGAS
jgi:hypothetical protein